MKKWLYSFKFIILIILFIGFAAYYYLTKINNSKDGFQERNDDDYHYPHFDISANYYNLTESEKARMKSVSADSSIINIGNSLSGSIDITNIPWDSENRSLSPKQILWGVVPREASASIYHKVYVAQQLAQLKAAEDGKFYFDSAMLHFGTSDPGLGALMNVADFIANFAGPLLVPMLGDKLGGSDPLFEKDVHDSPNTNQKNVATNIDGVMDAQTEKKEVTKMMRHQHSRVSHILGNVDEVGKPPVIKENPVDTVTQQNAQNVKFKASRILGKLITLFFDWIELIPPPVGPALNAVYMIIIMPIVMAMAMPLIAPKKGSNAKVEMQIGVVATTLVAMAVTAGLGFWFPFDVTIQRATLAAALAGAVAAYFEQQSAIPAGYKSMMEKMISQTGHGSGDGKCPNGFVPLDRVWNPTTELFISFCPIFGDIIDLLYPYMCVRKNATDGTSNDRAQNIMENLICIRDPYVLPKYMEQSWISSMFLEWPDYNNKLSTGTNIVGGKLRIVPNTTLITQLNQINQGVDDATGLLGSGVGVTGETNLPQYRTTPYWSWSGYTNFNDIKNNPNNYYNLNVKLENFQRKDTYEYIGGRKKESQDPDPTFRFFYLDFSDPNILIEMAQFYYYYAIRNPQLGDDRTFTIEYIAKINYVTSSSVFSCDAMCEMISIQYDARSGKFIKETRTYDSDRRFYFRWKPVSGTTGPCMPVTDIWGNDANNSVWRALDDAYDEAMYALNDAIHFPTDPTEDPTGLIGGDVLICAYELYLEIKERTDAAADYIIATYPNFIDSVTNKSLTELKSEYQTLLSTTNYTTAQLADDESVTKPATANSLNIAEDNFENALQRADQFYLDFKIIKDTATSNYINLLSQLYTTNENPHIFFKNDLKFRGDIINDLQSRMNAVIAAREALWNQHKRDSSTNPTSTIDKLKYKYGYDSTFMTTKYYDVTGCTHIDGSAPVAITPDVRSQQNDIRFPCQFDVLPHIKRCEKINITLDKCIDLSNIEQVIQAVQREKPDLRIKTIHNIKARGNNTCQYIWDEYDKGSPTVIREKTVNRILYQQDLSACTFCLPEVIPVGGTTKVQKIYIDTSDDKIDEYNSVGDRIVGSLPITTSLTSLTVPAAATDINHYFQPLDNYKNTNNKLAFKKAIYNRPDLPSGGGEPINTVLMTNQLYIPRYDVNNNGRKLPELVRPKKAIRITYPNTQELSLGPTTPTNFSNYCSDPVNMSNFMLRYNRIHSDELIVNIQRAFTTSSNTCDYEIDVFTKKPIQKDINGNPIMSGINTIPLLETDIKQIVKIDEQGTKVKLPSVKGFSKSMMVNIGYTMTDTITYTHTTYLIVGVGKLTPIIFNPYENALRTRLTTSTNTEYIGANTIIVGFELHNYKLVAIEYDAQNYNIPTNLTCIVSVTLYNSVSKLTTKKVIKFSITAFTIVNHNISNTATIVTNIGVSVPTTVINSLSTPANLDTELTSLGSLTPIVTDETEYVGRVITLNETITAYDSVLTTRSLSQSIQGLRVISSIDASDNTIIYRNDEDKTPLEIDYYPEDDDINDDGSHTKPPNIKNIPATAATIGKITLENILTRKTVSYNMTSIPPLTEAYTNTPFTYSTSDPLGYRMKEAPGGGLEIKRTTSTLSGSYSNSGYNFGGPAKSNIDNKFGSNTTYYNDNLVTEYTTSMSNLLNKTSEFLKPLVQAIKLSNIPSGETTDRCATLPAGLPPTNVCSNPTYMQRIMDAYNNGNSPIGIYNQERNTMTKIIQASTTENNRCHLIFENKNEKFNDITYYDLNNPNNYTVTNTLKFMSFPMSTITTTSCDFIPRKVPLSDIIGSSTISIYPAIKASDLTLSYGNNFPPPYISPLRNSICQVGDTTVLYTALIADYSNKVNVAGNPLTYTTISKLNKRAIGYDKIDYLLSQSNSANPNSIKKVILRAKFDLGPSVTTCDWSYTPNSFKVQIVLPNTISVAEKLRYTSLSFVDLVDSNSVTLRGTDNISPLFYDPEL